MDVDLSQVLRPQRDMKIILGRTFTSIAPVTQYHASETYQMPRSHRVFTFFQAESFGTAPLGTAIGSLLQRAVGGCELLRTVAEGCERQNI